jgi:hypothetical protein
MTPLSSHFEDEAWLCQLAYLTGIFFKLNDLNLNLQGNRNNIFSMEDKGNFCVARTSELRKFGSISTTLDFLDENDRIEPPAGTQSHIMQHLENLSEIPVILPILDRRLRCWK